MEQTLSARPILQQTSPDAIVQRSSGEHEWRIASDHASAITSGEIDWFALREGPGVSLVKRNSHRDVWLVRCGGREYFAKLYHPNGLASRLKALLRGPVAMREWDVGMYAAAHSVATVVPIAKAWRRSRASEGSSLLITEAVAGVEPLNDFWLRICEDGGEGDLLADALARLIARAHQCGLQHQDMHPGNILVRRVGHRHEAFFVDLHSVRTARVVSIRDVVTNLVQLNQWFRRHASRTQRLRFLRRYLDYRRQFTQSSAYARELILEDRALLWKLDREADRHANRLWAKRDRRSLRDGRYFALLQPAPGWRAIVLLKSKHPTPTARASRLSYDRKEWKAWLADPLAWIDPARQVVLKDSHTAVVCQAELPTNPPMPVIVKRSLARNAWRRIVHALGSSRNLRTWRTANRMLNRDLPVAQPVAVAEKFIAGLIRTDSMVFTDYVADSADLETFLTRDVARLDERECRGVKDRLMTALVRLIRQFHERGFVHRDFKAPNLLVQWAAPFSDAPLLTFIDMDGIRHVRRVSERQRDRALVRMAASLLSCRVCTRSDLLRFLRRSLLSPGRTDRGWKEEWRRLERLVEGKVEAKAQRREWKLAHYGRE